MAFITFVESDAVDKCMKTSPNEWKIDTYPVACQRYLLSGRTFDRSYHLLLFFDDDEAKKTLKEDELCEYFEMYYGKIKKFSWSSDKVATIEFEKFVSLDEHCL